MKVTRRDFLKISGATAAGLYVSQLGFDLSPASAYAATLRIKGAKETTTICAYCAVGCGIICHTSGGKVINTEGNPDHPINQGSLCAKGAALYQWVTNGSRITTPLYRAPGSASWKQVSWDWALNEIAKRVKDARDKGFVKTNARRVRRPGQRGVLDHPGHDEGPGARLYRAPGTYLTQRYGSGSGRVVRTWRHDESLDRYRQQRLRPDHGQQRRREPPDIL
jgi:formate dehydrogenase major subunit